MNSLSEIKDPIINFWDMEEEEQRTLLLDSISAYASAKEETAFVKEVREMFEQVNFSGISVIYEALSRYPEKWSQFFKEEYERAFATAEKSDHATEVLDCLQEISFVDENKFTRRDDLIKILSRYLSSSKDTVSYKAIWYLGDWIDPDNAGKYGFVIQKIKDKLTDKNWRIRHVAKSTLEDIGQLPDGYKPGFMDKMKAKFLNPYNLK